MVYDVVGNVELDGWTGTFTVSLTQNRIRILGRCFALMETRQRCAGAHADAGHAAAAGHAAGHAASARRRRRPTPPPGEF